MFGHANPLHETHSADDRWLLSARQFLTRDPVRTLTMLVEPGSPELGDESGREGEASPVVEV